MKIGITFDLKASMPTGPNVPDDAYEEFDSLQTIESIAAVLRGLGHTVVLLGDGREFIEKVLADRPDFVFNFAEGHGVSRSREARVPAVLEMLGIPFTGSDPFTLAVTLDKDCAKKLVAAAGVAVPASHALDATAPLSSIPLASLKFPLLVKPAWEGSSKGIRNRCLVNAPAEVADVVASLRRDHPQTILLEEFIAGDELTVGLHGNAEVNIIGIMRVAPTQKNERFIYSLEVKRDYKGKISFEVPPPYPAPILERIEQSARTAYRALACRDIARVDFRLRDGVPYFLEVNPLPGLNAVDSDLCILARLAGWSYERLVSTILEAAIRRVGMSHMSGAK
ncbi:MAG TPA: ATP-grasp domain-containing protein [Gemmataceae bacterium]|nr:ATP-grasp domain-containing protein [Gemmataceae bacterium]